MRTGCSISIDIKSCPNDHGVVPIGKVAGALFVILATPQLSVAVAKPIFNVLLVQSPGSVPAETISPGQFIIGLSWSLIVIVKLHEVELPPTSIAVYITVVIPTGKVLAGAMTVQL